MRRAIFWDFDGTLTNGEPSWRSCMVMALGPLAERYDVTEEKLRPFLKSGFPWHPDGDSSLTGEDFWLVLLDKFSAAFEALGVPKVEARNAALEVRNIVQDATLYHVQPDAAATLAVCAFKGYKNYILTNNFPEWENLLIQLGLRQFFPGIINSGVAGACKPDERIFRIAERIANFPSLIWMVGDNPIADILGAKNAGWHAAHITKPGTKSSGADVTVTSLSELLKFL